MGDFHPISRCHICDSMRSFYSALGHISGIDKNQYFPEPFYESIYWVANGRGIDK